MSIRDFIMGLFSCFRLTWLALLIIAMAAAGIGLWLRDGWRLLKR